MPEERARSRHGVRARTRSPSSTTSSPPSASATSTGRCGSCRRAQGPIVSIDDRRVISLVVERLPRA